MSSGKGRNGHRRSLQARLNKGGRINHFGREKKSVEGLGKGQKIVGTGVQ